MVFPNDDWTWSGPPSDVPILRVRAWFRMNAFGVMSLMTIALPQDYRLPSPPNRSYYHMTLTVYAAFGAAELFTYYVLYMVPELEVPLVFFEVLFLTLHAVGWAWVMVYLRGALCLVVIGFVLGLALLTLTQDTQHWLELAGWPHEPARSRALYPLCAVCLILPLGLLAGPITQDWSDPNIEPYVRWHPYSVDHELIWRLTFLAFALAFAVIANMPLSSVALCVFFGAHCVMHGLVMLIDNAINLDGNGNPEHRVEITVFLLLGVFFSVYAYTLSKEAMQLYVAVPAESSTEQQEQGDNGQQELQEQGARGATRANQQTVSDSESD
eukprot:g24523.t1